MFPRDVLIVADEANFFPKKGDAYAAGYDLVVNKITDCNTGRELLSDETGRIVIPRFSTVSIECGFRMALPSHLFALVVPRSSWRKRGLVSLAVYDPGYLDSVAPYVTNLNSSPLEIYRYERILQMILLPISEASLSAVQSLNGLYNRGGGSGSTGRW